MKQALAILLAAVMALAIAAALLAAVVVVVSLPPGRSFTAAEQADWRARHCDRAPYATRVECTSTRDWR